MTLSDRDLVLDRVSEHGSAVVGHQESRQDNNSAVEASQIADEREQGVDLPLVLVHCVGEHQLEFKERVWLLLFIEKERVNSFCINFVRRSFCLVQGQIFDRVRLALKEPHLVAPVSELVVRQFHFAERVPLVVELEFLKQNDRAHRLSLILHVKLLRRQDDADRV